MHILTNKIIFPPVEDADEDGFLAAGGNLQPDTLILAYRNGIFPWYNAGEPICWWSPDPRCVLYPGKLYISNSMKKVIRTAVFSFRVNQAFEQVMHACKTTRRKEGYGTWIQDEMISAYTALHRLGFAHSAESWLDGKLVGGLYGIRIGKVFFGESMFSTVSNASKYAFISLVQRLCNDGVQLIDCQQRTEHLVSLGAEMIPRQNFIRLLDEYCPEGQAGKG